MSKTLKEYKTEERKRKQSQIFAKLFNTVFGSLSFRYLIHWPGVSGLKSDHKDNLVYRHRTWNVLTKLNKTGLIKSIGVSNFLVSHLEELKNCESEIKTPAVNQVEWHPRHNDPELLKYCREQGIFLQAYSSLGSSNAVSLRHDPTVQRVAEKLGKSASQVLLRWAFQQNIGILPKASSRGHIVENIDLNFTLPDEAMKALSELHVKEKYAWDPTVVV